MKPNEFQRAFDHALDCHRRGKLMEADAGYRRILKSYPQHADSRHLLGLIAYQQGRPAEAVEVIQGAIGISPRVPDYHSNLGEALRALGRMKEAQTAYETALALKPDFVLAWNNLGIALEAQGETEEARLAYQKAIGGRRDYFEAWHNLGVLQDRLGEYEASLISLETALRLNPGSADVHCSRGKTLHHLGRNPEAIESYHRALQRDAQMADAHYSLGIAFQATGELDRAAAAYAEAERLRPRFADAFNNHAYVLLDLGRRKEAEAKARQAVELDPNHSAAWNSLGLCLTKGADYEPAKRAFETSIAVDPNNYKAYSNLAMVLHVQRRWKECLEAIQKALALKPDYYESLNFYAQVLVEACEPSKALAVLDRAIELAPKRVSALVTKAHVFAMVCEVDAALALYQRSLDEKPDDGRAINNFLYTLNAVEKFTPEKIAEFHVMLAGRLQKAFPAPGGIRGGTEGHDRRLKVGFVSPDFRSHSIARFIEPLWREHDREKFEYFAYSNVALEDSTTQSLKSRVTHWRKISCLNDDETAASIMADRIDILVDLSGHTGSNRLGVFIRRAAPVQVSWLGYPNTTGVTAMDFKITDAVADPVGMTEHLHTEELMRLEGPAWCFQAPLTSPPTVDPPAATAGRITFCSFNNTVKCSARTLELWSRILLAVPGSRLLLKSRMFADPRVWDVFLQRLRPFGVKDEQVQFSPWTEKTEAHLALYNQADIALDTYPYHGTTTTCEALWMGLPVVTLEGRTHVSRVGVSLLTHLGLEAMIAKTDADYVEIARRLAEDLNVLTTLRRGLRERMAKSVLMDGAHFARSFGAACEAMVSGRREQGS